MAEIINGICVARSRKNCGNCLAIYDIDRKRIYRIISNDIDRVDGELFDNECMLNIGRLIENLDNVLIMVKNRIPIDDEYQKENLFFENNEIKFIKKINKNELIDLYGGEKLNAHPFIFYNTWGSMNEIEAKKCQTSFIIAKVYSLEFYIANNKKGERTCKCKFKYNCKNYVDISVTICKDKNTDILYYAGKHYSSALVCFSFGHPYEGKCFKYLCSFLGYWKWR